MWFALGVCDELGWVGPNKSVGLNECDWPVDRRVGLGEWDGPAPLEVDSRKGET